MKSKSFLGKLMAYIYEFNSGFLCAISTIMFLLMCVEVFIRYILRAMEEYIYFFLMWLVMLGAANAVLENSHLRSDTLTMLIKNKKVLNTIMIFVEVVELTLYAMFAFYAALYLRDAIELPAYSRVRRLPKLLGQSAVFYGGVFMLLFGAYRFAANLRHRFKAYKAYQSGELDRTEDIPASEEEEAL